MRLLRMLAAACGCLAAAAAQGAPATLASATGLDAKVVEASLFKNGLAYVTREMELPGPGEHVLRSLPVPVHGSFWLLPESKATVIEHAAAFSAPRAEPEEAMTLVDLLRANVGRKVEVLTETEGWVAAAVERMPQRQPKLPVPLADAASRSYGYGYWGTPRSYRPPSADSGQSGETPGFVLLRTEKGMLALPPGSIKGIRNADGSLESSFDQARPGAALRIRVKGAGGRVRISYLEWGLTWAPSYQVDVSDAKEASILCKAEVLNDVEELRGATLRFITGYPNLAFAEAVDPIALLGNVPDFLQSLMLLTQPRRRTHPSAMQQVVLTNVAGAPAEGPRLPQETGESREDLFFYPQAGVTLARGERGYFPLFAKRVPCESIYVWEIPDSLDERMRWRYAGWYDRQDPPEEQEEVWHSLRLANAGGIPWTTAPAMTVQEGRILGQDMLRYTAPGAKTLLKITRAVDVTAEQGEVEIERQRNARTAYGGAHTYDLVTVKGELRVFNHKSKPIMLQVKKTLSGDVLEATPRPVTETTVAGVWRVNAQQRLVWEVPVEAGGKQYISYRYKVYAAR